MPKEDETVKLEKIRYNSIKGDRIDKLLEKYVNSHNVYIPIKRLEERQYLFGTKKVTAQIINGALMIRVGGGYMTIEEFVDKHVEKEITNLKVRMKKEKKDVNEVVRELTKKYKYKHFTSM